MQNLISNLIKKKSPRYSMINSSGQSLAMGEALQGFDMHPHDIADGISTLHRGFGGAYTDQLLTHVGVPREYKSPEGHVLKRSGLNSDGSRVIYSNPNTGQEHHLGFHAVMTSAVRRNYGSIATDLLNRRNRYVEGKPHPMSPQGENRLGHLGISADQGKSAIDRGAKSAEDTYNARRILGMNALIKDPSV